MRLPLCCLVLATLSVTSQGRDLPAIPVTLYTQFQENPPQLVMEALQHEVAAIMAPSGMRVEWRSLESVTGSQVSVELAVISFKGTCQVTGAPGREKRSGALGWTHVSDGVVLAFSDIDCDRIRTYLRDGLSHIPPALRERAFGRGIGRVLAHELYHIFAQTTEHGSCGVAKAAYTVQELLTQDFRFEKKESRALRASPAHAALVRASFTASSAP